MEATKLNTEATKLNTEEIMLYVVVRDLGDGNFEYHGIYTDEVKAIDYQNTLQEAYSEDRVFITSVEANKPVCF